MVDTEEGTDGENEREYHRVLTRVSHAATRGASVGMGLRGGLHVASYALRLVSSVAVRRRQRRGLMIRHGRESGFQATVKKILRDTAAHGLFLGTFSASFVMLDEGIAYVFGRERTRAWRALLSGFLSGPSLMLTGVFRDGTNDRHTSLAIYLVLRGIMLLVRCGNIPLEEDDSGRLAPPPATTYSIEARRSDSMKEHPAVGQEAGSCVVSQKRSTNGGNAAAAAGIKRPKVRRAWIYWLLTPTRFAYGDVVLMCLATAQLGYSWVILPSTLPGSYIKFLNTHGGKSPLVLEGIRDVCSRRTRRMPCDIVHPGQSCSGHALTFFPRAYLRALPVYIPVYIVPALLIHRQKLLQKGNAARIWPKIVKGCLRSSLFLSLYCTLAWRGVCVGFQTTGKSTGTIIASSCWVAGVALLAEKKSRRMELAVYALARALESFSMSLVEWGYVPKSKNLPRIDVLLFSIATAAICHCYSDHNGKRRDVFAGKYLNVFDFIFGNTGFTNSGRIRHVPTNKDLVAMAGETGFGKRVRSFARSIGNDLAALSRNPSIPSSISSLSLDSDDDAERKYM
ncbi:hypothetical protein PSENEW3_00001330 [Picochlorum sp. SENEW3]|nr:hypothetical protein PSENEW3_00001330 [Picochlorum sp. SENEW3]